MHANRINLEKAYNVRELGGYANENNVVTNFRSFLRSDEVAHLNESDIEKLLQYGVTSVIDLRSEKEAAFAQNPFAQMDKICYRNLPLLTMDKEMLASFGDLKALLSTHKGALLAKMYIEILKTSKKQIKEIFEFIAQQDGVVLFHCAAGKDRTGVLAMLLLALAGVGRADIIANYMVTEVYIKENPNRVMASLPIDLPEELMASKPEYMAAAYDYMMDHYETAEAYLLSTGVSSEVLQKVKDKLLSSHL